MQTDASLLDLLHNSAVGRYHQAYAKLQNADFVQDVPQSALVVIGLQVNIQASPVRILSSSSHLVSTQIPAPGFSRHLIWLRCNKLMVSTRGSSSLWHFC